MSMSSMEMHSEVCNNTKEDVVKVLLNIAKDDLEFSTNNKNLWYQAKENGFTSNADYCINVVKDKPIDKMVGEFVDLWMARDPYYEFYKVDCKIVDNKVFICLAYTLDC